MRKGFMISSMALAATILGFAHTAPAHAFQPVGSMMAMKPATTMTIKPVAFPTQVPLTRSDEREAVTMPGAYEAGSILVVNSERKLYLSLGDGRAYVYPIAIGKPGMSWTGTSTVVNKVKDPTWTPTPNTRRMKPNLPAFVSAGPNNPLGPRALYLAKGFYRIHGTNKPESIGSAASLGCFRMYNKDVLDLFARVEVGAKVTVIN